MKKISLLLISTLCAFNLAAQTYSGGSGTEADPYLISSKADMEALATATNGSSSYSTGKYFLLTQDITETVTTIIGNVNFFKGTFDGGGHTITVNISTTAQYVGVFGYVSSVTIKNLGVTGSVTRTSSSSSSSCAGGICGYASNTTITNCYNKATITATAPGSYNAFAGGICGCASATTTITNCYNAATVSATSSSSYNSYAGGICGYLYGSTTNCLSANSSISAKVGSTNSTNIGRILGYLYSGTISNCYANAAMTLNGSTVSSQDAASKNGKDIDNPIWFNKYTCSYTATTIFLQTTSPLKWQRSSDNASTWTDIACTNFYYTEPNPAAGHYIYRAQNGDGTYSPYVEVTYHDAVPATINALPLTGATKTVDESITFSLELTDDNYSYQWYKDNTAIEGATTNTYAVPVVKSADAGVYKCKVWNGCNEVYSETSTLTVNKCPQVITFPEIPAATYGDAPITLPATTDKGLTITYQSVNTNVATVSGNVLTVVNPGTSTIIASQGGNADYLLANSVERTLTVNKQTQTITFPAIAQKRYGDPAFTLPATTDKGLTISYQVINTNVATVSGNTVTILNAGETDIVATQAGDNYRYAATQVSQTLTVVKANQTITFANFDSKIYGDADIVLNEFSDGGLTVTYTSDNTDVATINGHTVILHNAGSANITATQAGNSNYNAAPSITRTLVIGKAGQAIVWDNIEAKTYGDAPFTVPQTTNKGLTISYSSDNENVATISGNTVTIVGAGTANITATQAGNNNYFPASSVTLPFTVSKAFQTITFGALSEKTYGDPSFSLNASVNSTQPVTYESSNTAVATVSGNTLTITGAGTTYITANAAGNGNYYAASPVQQQLTVNKAAQSITLDAIPDKTYGDVPFTLNALASTGLSVTYSSSDANRLLISGNQAIILGAGTFTVTATQSGNSNYLPISTTRTFTVSKANLTVKADNKTREYGSENPALTLTYTGFVNGDAKNDLNTQPSPSCSATQTSTVGDYPITVSGGSDSNYTLIYQNGTLSIGTANLTVRPNDATRYYGDANPAFVLAYSGFKNGETSDDLTTAPIAVSTAGSGSAVGDYPIYASGGSAQNYNILYENGVLHIVKAPVTVVAEDKTREYGDANPIFTYLLNGLKNGESASDIDVLPTLTTTATQGSNAGSYTISVSGASDGNYSFSYTNATLTVSKAMLQVHSADKTREYGDANGNFTLIYTGFKNGETESVLTTQPSVTSSFTNTTNAGVYNIVTGGGVATNYYFNYTYGTLTITKAPLTITADNKSRLAGAANPTFTLSYSGFKNSETASVLDVLPSISCSANASSPAGNYDIVLSGGNDNNYEYTLVNGVLEVTNVTDIPYLANMEYLKIYPNPAKDHIVIAGLTRNPMQNVQIFDISGRAVGARFIAPTIAPADNGTATINVSHLPSGVYFVKIGDKRGKFVKE